MKIQSTTIYVDHFLTPHQIAKHIELESRISLAFRRPILLRESTAKWPLNEEELIARLIRSDCIVFISDNDLPLEIWATKYALAIELPSDKYNWIDILLQEPKFNSVKSITSQLMWQFGSNFAVIAPSLQGVGVAREFFTEGIHIYDLIERLRITSGTPLGILTDEAATVKFDSMNLVRGYLVFIKNMAQKNQRG